MKSRKLSKKYTVLRELNTLGTVYLYAGKKSFCMR